MQVYRPDKDVTFSDNLTGGESMAWGRATILKTVQRRHRRKRKTGAVAPALFGAIQIAC